MPRSGTVFFLNFIAELFGFSKLEPLFTNGFRPNPPKWNPYEFDKTYLQMKNGEVLCAHYKLSAEIDGMLNNKDTLAIYLYRDPRDVTVSSALYIKYGLPHHVLHKTFQKMSDSDAIAFMIKGGIITEDMFPEDMVPSVNDYILFEGLSNLIENSYAWIDDQRVVHIRYEDFFTNPNVLVNAAKKAGVIVDTTRVEEVSKKLSFKLASNGRTRGEEDKSSHFRKGVIGDYKNYFSELHAALARNFLGQSLIRLGYEQSIAWRFDCNEKEKC
jgi:hypothetical protein